VSEQGVHGCTRGGAPQVCRCPTVGEELGGCLDLERCGVEEREEVDEEEARVGGDLI
jgi:hypothetical protein